MNVRNINAESLLTGKTFKINLRSMLAKAL